MTLSNYIFGPDGKAYLFREGKIVASADNVADLEKLADANSQFGHPDLGYMPPEMANQNANQNTSPGQPCTTCGGRGCPNCQFAGSYAGAAGRFAKIDDGNFGESDEAKKNRDEKKKKSDSEPQSDDPTQTNDVAEVLKHRNDKATHVVTPNGLKGKIVSHVQGLWADEITVRLDNGRISKFEVVPGEEYQFSNEDNPFDSPYKTLRSRLDEVPSGTRGSLVERIAQLEDIETEAKTLLHTAAYVDQVTLDEIIVLANHEMREAAGAIEALDSVEPVDRLQPFGINVLDGGPSLHGVDGDWLDSTLGDMISETESQDFDRLMEEGPEQLVSGMEDGMVADAGEVRAYASTYLSSRTVGIEPTAAEEFKQAFLARVEDVRRQEESNRRVAMNRMAKTASLKEELNADGPAEELFL